MDPTDRSTSLETSLSSESCTVCADLQRMFANNEVSTLFDTPLKTTCLGHGPLFDSFWADICKRLSEDNEMIEKAKGNYENKEGQSKEENQDHASELYTIFFASVPEPDGKRPFIWTESPESEIPWYWTPVMARSHSEPQTPGFGRVLDPDWVDLELARRWKRDCLVQHNDKCCNPLKIDAVSPAWVIDTAKRCIVPGADISEYVALSYRWGVSAGFCTTRHLLKALQEPGAFSQGSRLCDSMAPILQHAMELTQAIDERYLWVDTVCIVQDDETHRATELKLMGAIYATAKLTIVASDGDAVDGISGLKGISPPRQIDQKVTPVFESEKVIFRDQPDFRSGSSPYFDRGWTYQEFYLSQRRLIFAKGQIYWQCACADWEEDIISSKDVLTGQSWMKSARLDVLKAQPDFPALDEMLTEYNSRQLKFPEDALPGISGLLSILSRSFDGGFLFGLPEAVFDSALMWHSQNFLSMKKREDSGGSNLLGLTSQLPLWSWVSWKSEDLYLGREETFKLSQPRRSWTIPITQWYTHETPEAISKRPIQSTWFRSRDKFKDPECELPEGWTREKYDGADDSQTRPPEGLGQYVYRYAAIVDETFWLPVPIATAGQDEDRLGPAQTPHISCNTKRGRFAAAQFPTSEFSFLESAGDHGNSPIGLLDGNGDYCGRLFLQGRDDISHFPEADSGCTCEVELVAICRRREVKCRENSWQLESEDYEEHQGFQDVYGVLWVEWIDGVAYRKASGVVGKDEWESYNLEDVHLVMG